MNATSRILLVAYHFPPQGGGGVQRPLKFAKTWSRDGAAVAVLYSRGHWLDDLDASQIDELPRAVVRRSAADRSPFLVLDRLRRNSPEALRRGIGRAAALIERMAVPDAYQGWAVSALLSGLRLARAFRPDVILTTGPPFTGFVAGALLSRALGLPLVLDYRDPWTATWVTVGRREPWPRRTLNPRLERAILRRAAAVVSAHRSVFRYLRTRFPDVAIRRKLWVPNGYDPDDFADPTAADPEHFTLTYAGSFYWFRQPRSIFQVFGDLVREGRVDPARTRFRIAGKTDVVTEACRAAPELAPVLRSEGYLRHADTIRLLNGSTVNLVIEGRTGEGRNEHTPGKFYEVLRAGRPVLLLCPDGVTTHLGRRIGGCRVCPPDDHEAIRRALLEMYEAWEAGRRIATPRVDRLRFYDRQHQARRLLRLLRRIAAERPGAPRG